MTTFAERLKNAIAEAFTKFRAILQVKGDTENE